MKKITKHWVPIVALTMMLFYSMRSSANTIELYSQNFNSLNAAPTDWKNSNSSVFELATDNENKFFQIGSGTESRSPGAYYSETEIATQVSGKSNYTIEFDCRIKEGTNTGNYSQGVWILGSNKTLSYNAPSTCIAGVVKGSNASAYTVKVNSADYVVNEVKQTVNLTTNTWYHYVFAYDKSSKKLSITIKSADQSSTILSLTDIDYDYETSGIGNLESIAIQAGRGNGTTAIDNILLTTESAVDVVSAPTATYTINGNNPTISNGTSSDNTATLTTYYCTSESADPATDGTAWVQGTTTLPSTGTYYFYTVSNKGGISNATTYIYLAGIYENYEFGSWSGAASAFDFASPTSFGGHSLYERFSFGSSWTVNGGIKTTAQGSTITINGLTTSDYIILTTTGGQFRTNSNNQLKLNGEGVDALTVLSSGTAYQCNSSSVSIWDRNSGGGGIITRIQIVTPSYTLTTPTIAYGDPGATTTVAVTPGVVRNTDENLAATTTYITTNGDDPTNEESTRVTSLTSVSESSTVKAASYYGGSYSAIASVYVPVGSVTLNVPSATFTGVGESAGHYYKLYTLNSDQSEYGSPEVAYTYEFSTDNFESVAASGNVTGTTFLAPGIGKLRFYATADGYTTSEASEVIDSDVEYMQTSVYNFVNYSIATNAELTTSNTSEYLYHAIPGIYLYNASNTITGMGCDSKGLYYLSDGNGGYYGVFGAFDGQILSNGSTFNKYANGKIEFNIWRGNSGGNRVSGLILYTPASLIATAGDVTLSDGVVDLSTKVIYSGNIEAIKTAIAALDGVKSIKVGQVGCDITAAQLNSLIPSDKANTVFVQLPENSYYEISSDVANLRTNDGVVALYTLTDGQDYATASSFIATAATSSRSYTANIVNTICLPFAIDNTDGTLGTFYTLADTQDGDKGVVKFKTVSTTEANKPYLFVPSATGTLTLAANTAFSAAAAATTTVGDYSLVGVQTAQSIVSDATATVYGFKTDGSLLKITTATNIKGMRAYLKVTGSSMARALVSSFGDETTGISNVEVVSENHAAYNLNGQRVEKAQNGLYIVNGKKVIVK